MWSEWHTSQCQCRGRALNWDFIPLNIVDDFANVKQLLMVDMGTASQHQCTWCRQCRSQSACSVPGGGSSGTGLNDGDGTSFQLVLSSEACCTGQVCRVQVQVQVLAGGLVAR
jgi:hypothetical protein